jgi:hypothetical protein
MESSAGRTAAASAFGGACPPVDNRRSWLRRTCKPAAYLPHLRSLPRSRFERMNAVGRKEKIFASITMAVEGIKLATDLLDRIQGRMPAARERAAEAIGSLRDETAEMAARLADDVRKKVRGGPSAVRVLQFTAGFGAGFGVALLFAPMPGSDARKNLYRMVSLSGADAGRSDSPSEPPMEERYGA